MISYVIRFCFRGNLNLIDGRSAKSAQLEARAIKTARLSIWKARYKGPSSTEANSVVDAETKRTTSVEAILGTQYLFLFSRSPRQTRVQNSSRHRLQLRDKIVTADRSTCSRSFQHTFLCPWILLMEKAPPVINHPRQGPFSHQGVSFSLAAMKSTARLRIVPSLLYQACLEGVQFNISRR